MKARTITVTGPFTDAEFAEIAALMRAIDRKHPNEAFMIVVDDPSGGLDAAERAVVAALATDPDRVSLVMTFPTAGSPGSPGNGGC
jgi:hypothetical protein